MKRPVPNIRERLGLLSALALLAGAWTPAMADVALLRNGRTLAVSDYRMDGDRVVLMMEGGGEIALLNDQIVAIRREPQAHLPAPASPPAGISPPAAQAALATLIEPRADPGPPMELVPGAVFDRE